jgi:peptidoglycan hydrolase-like protein with peptidoglycan-binding domain
MNPKILDLQKRLNELGYGPLEEDGKYGSRTAEAFKLYQDEIDPDTPTVIPTPQQKWWTSKRFLGGVGTILVGILGILGYSVEAEALTQILVALVTLGTGTISLIGALRENGEVDIESMPTRTSGMRRKNDSEYKDPRGLFGD